MDKALIARMWDLATRTWPYVSLLVNALLLLALYFRTALNQLAVDWMAQRAAKRELLIHLYDNVRRYVGAATGVAHYEYIWTVKPDTYAEIKPFQDQAMAVLEETKSFIDENRIRLAQPIQRELDSLVAATVGLANILNNPGEFQEVNRRITAAGNRALVEIEKSLGVS